MIHAGKKGDYHWLVSGFELHRLAELVLTFHRSYRLCITSFDSGPLRLAKSEIDIGWTMQGEVAVSPPLDSTTEISHDLYDEWYIMEQPSFGECDIEVFVNFGAFTLADPMESIKAGIEGIPSLQARFWLQLQKLNPETYVAMGDNDIVVSRNEKFIEAVQTYAGELG